MKSPTAWAVNPFWIGLIHPLAVVLGAHALCGFMMIAGTGAAPPGGVTTHARSALPATCWPAELNPDANRLGMATGVAGPTTPGTVPPQNALCPTAHAASSYADV